MSHPHLFEAAGAGQLDGVVSAVVEVALIAMHSADGGVGRHHTVKAGGNIDQLLGHEVECHPDPTRNQR
jgi:hypothetical protein